MTTVQSGAALPAFARTPVLAVAVAIGALLTAVSGRYGYFGDELYFVAAGRNLDWGYADQPTLVPLIARAMDTIAPGSLTVLRLPSVLLTMLGIVLAALLARELGGARRAQLVAAAAFATSPFLLGTGHLLATSTVDPVLWTLVTWLVVRWVRSRDDRLLLAAGLVTAVALQAKVLIVAFWVVLAVAVLLVGPREMLRRPLLWVGGAVAVLATVPTLLWQAANGWPQLGMSRAIAAEGAYVGGAAWFLPVGVAFVGGLAGTVLAIYGVVRLLRSPELAPYRFLALTALGVITVFLVAGGRPYYIAGVFPVLWAAGAVELGRAARWWRWIASWPVFGATGLAFVFVLNIVPVAPIESHAGKPLMVGNFQLDEFGWPQYVDDVAAAYHALPPETAAHTVLLSSSYWGGAALEFYGPERGLPAAYSANRGYAWFGVPPEEATAAVLLSSDPGPWRGLFDEVRQVGVADNDADVNNLVQGTPIWVLEGRTVPWEQVWAETRSL